MSGQKSVVVVCRRCGPQGKGGYLGSFFPVDQEIAGGVVIRCERCKRLNWINHQMLFHAREDGKYDKTLGRFVIEGCCPAFLGSRARL